MVSDGAVRTTMDPAIQFLPLELTLSEGYSEAIITVCNYSK